MSKKHEINTKIIRKDWFFLWGNKIDINFFIALAHWPGRIQMFEITGTYETNLITHSLKHSLILLTFPENVKAQTARYPEGCLGSDAPPIVISWNGSRLLSSHGIWRKVIKITCFIDTYNLCWRQRGHKKHTILKK